MNENIISYETALLIEATELNSWQFAGQVSYNKEKRELCNPDVLSRDNRIYAPTQSMVQKWLREKHKIDCWVAPYVGVFPQQYSPIVYQNGSDVTPDLIDCKDYLSYEDAFEDGLYHSLLTLKTK